MRRIAGPFLALIVLSVLLLALPAVSAQAAKPDAVVVYYNRACADCLHYIEESVVPLLRRAGYSEPAYRDYVNEPANRTALIERSDALGVPPNLQSHLTVFVGDRLILEGHIPEHVVADLLAAPPETFDRMLVYQDKMTGATDYVAWAFRGEPQTYALESPIGEYLAYLEEHGEHLMPAMPGKALDEERALLPLVLSTGFIDGLNPCAFAVLLFFIAFLFTIQRTSGAVWAMGLVYVAAIYVAYLLIGLGLMQAVLFTNNHHLMAKIGSWLVIALGLINLKDYFFPQLPIHLRIPTIAHGTIQNWIPRRPVHVPLLRRHLRGDRGLVGGQDDLRAGRGLPGALQPGLCRSAADHPGGRGQPARHASHPVDRTIEQALGAAGYRAGDGPGGRRHPGVVCLAGGRYEFKDKQAQITAEQAGEEA